VEGLRKALQGILARLVRRPAVADNEEIGSRRLRRPHEPAGAAGGEPPEHESQQHAEHQPSPGVRHPLGRARRVAPAPGRAAPGTPHGLASTAPRWVSAVHRACRGALTAPRVRWANREQWGIMLPGVLPHTGAPGTTVCTGSVTHDGAHIVWSSLIRELIVLLLPWMPACGTRASGLAWLT
jgi:hypothetical protein